MTASAAISDVVLLNKQSCDGRIETKSRSVAASSSWYKRAHLLLPYTIND